MLPFNLCYWLTAIVLNPSLCRCSGQLGMKTAVDKFLTIKLLMKYEIMTMQMIDEIFLCQPDRYLSDGLYQRLRYPQT